MGLKKKKDNLYVVLKNGDKNYRLCLESSDSIVIERFVFLCKSNLDDRVNYFHQANSHNFQMFEFWCNDLPLILEECSKIAVEMELDLLVVK